MTRPATEQWLPKARAVFEQHWGTVLRLEPLSAGRVNDSFLVTVDQPPSGVDTARFVLQRVNTELFQYHEQLIEQSLRVVEHVNRGAREEGGTGGPAVPTPRVPAWLPSMSGQHAVWQDDQLWRVFWFIEGEPLARGKAALCKARLGAAAAAFAELQQLLETLPGPRLEPNIPYLYQFHLTLDVFDTVAAKAPYEWRQRVDRYRDQWLHLTATDGYIHGDCKPDNILFLPGSTTAAAVLDLDTVMWGNRWWDFGDLVRSASWQGEAFCLQRYGTLLRGYLGRDPGHDLGHDLGRDLGQGTSSPAAQQERRLRAELDQEAVLDAPMYVTFLLVLRYLTDHLSGDRHFKVRRVGDNLRRAEDRFARLEQMIAKRSAMAAVLQSELG